MRLFSLSQLVDQILKINCMMAESCAKAPSCFCDANEVVSIAPHPQWPAGNLGEVKVCKRLEIHVCNSKNQASHEQTNCESSTTEKHRNGIIPNQMSQIKCVKPYIICNIWYIMIYIYRYSYNKCILENNISEYKLLYIYIIYYYISICV